MVLPRFLLSIYSHFLSIGWVLSPVSAITYITWAGQACSVMKPEEQTLTHLIKDTTSGRQHVLFELCIYRSPIFLQEVPDGYREAVRHLDTCE